MKNMNSPEMQQKQKEMEEFNRQLKDIDRQRGTFVDLQAFCFPVLLVFLISNRPVFCLQPLDQYYP